jgi:Zn-dependent protease with chaperone function
MPMNFFEAQDAARRKTKVLVVMFFAAVAAIVTCIYFLLVLILGGEVAWNTKLFLWASLGTLAVVAVGSTYKASQLASGGEVLAQLLGGRLISSDTRDADERRLLNVVEEMAIASGVPVPPVYLMEKESGINAFAAGFSPTDAVVGVTRGTMTALSRDELQGVIAHEFSHILNGDMRLNIRLMGVLHGILLIGILGQWMVRSARYAPRSSDTRASGAILAAILIGLMLMVIGYVGVFFGKLIKSAASRQREYLADASAVQFTRNPSGIAGVLKKIGGLTMGSTLASPNAEQASHMFIADALPRFWLGALATHPPLEDRIRRIEPRWDGRFVRVEPPAKKAPRRREKEEKEDLEKILGPEMTAVLAGGVVAGGGAAPARGAQAQRATAMRSKEILDRVGAPGREHLQYAAQLKAAIPEAVTRAAHEPFGARAVVYAMLLDREKKPRRLQLERLERHADKTVYQETLKLAPEVETLPDETRLPLVDIAIPALSRLSPAQYEAFRKNVRHLVEADEQIDIFEFMLQCVLLRHLEPRFAKKRKPPVVQYYAMKPLASSCARLLSSLAYAGHDEAGRAARAFELGAARVNLSARILPTGEAGLDAVGEAMDVLTKASPQIKRRVLDACIVTTAADGLATIHEAELLRAVADGLDCPVPPFLPGQDVG